MIEKWFKKKLNVPKNWDKYDYEQQRYSFNDMVDFAEQYHIEQCAMHDIRQSAFAVIPDAERYLGGTNEVIAVFKHREQAERFAKALWKQYYIIEEIQSPHFA